jgi:hypothetical protein
MKYCHWENKLLYYLFDIVQISFDNVSTNRYCLCSFNRLFESRFKILYSTMMFKCQTCKANLSLYGILFCVWQGSILIISYCNLLRFHQCVSVSISKVSEQRLTHNTKFNKRIHQQNTCVWYKRLLFLWDKHLNFKQDTIILKTVIHNYGMVKHLDQLINTLGSSWPLMASMSMVFLWIGHCLDGATHP